MVYYYDVYISGKYYGRFATAKAADTFLKIKGLDKTMNCVTVVKGIANFGE